MFDTDSEAEAKVAEKDVEEALSSIEEREKQFLSVLVEKCDGRAKTSEISPHLVKKGPQTRDVMSYTFRKLQGNTSVMDVEVIKPDVYEGGESAGESEEKVAELTPLGEELVSRGVLDGGVDMSPTDPVEALSARVDDLAGEVEYLRSYVAVMSYHLGDVEDAPSRETIKEEAAEFRENRE